VVELPRGQLSLWGKGKKESSNGSILRKIKVAKDLRAVHEDQRVVEDYPIINEKQYGHCRGALKRENNIRAKGKRANRPSSPIIGKGKGKGESVTI